MSLAILMGLFLFKHGLLCHVVDFGYSRSRRHSSSIWYLGLLTHTSAEFLVSLYILRNWTWEVAGIALGLELAILLASGLIERRAPLRKLLRIHLISEMMVMVTYFVAAFTLISGRAAA